MADQDNYSDIQQEVPASADRERDPANVVTGLKATLSNPQVSDAAKQHAREELDRYGEPHEAPTRTQATGTGSADNVARGLKASLTNQNVSQEAKERAREKLEEM